MNVTSRIEEIERRLKSRRRSVAELCRSADIAQTTWGRWKNGTEPRGKSWERVETAIQALDAADVQSREAA